ncbi:MAG: DUF1801 domain-containing protein [Microbacteriaceae bacterium]
MADRFRTVDEFLAAQPPARREQVDALRAIVIEAAPELSEIVKWNSPSYTLDGIDRLTVNSAPGGPLRLILHFGTARTEHTGAEHTFMNDPDALLSWHSDIRASLMLPPLDELDAKRQPIIDVIRAWLAHT